MNEKLLVGIGVGIVLLGCGTIVVRASAQSAPSAITAAPAVDKTVMRMHCSACRVVRPETLEAPVVLEPQRYWRGQLPIPSGYTHWVPPVDDYVKDAPDIAVIPLPEILRGTLETTQVSETQTSLGGWEPWISEDGLATGFRQTGNAPVGPRAESDEITDKRRNEEQRQRDIDNMLKDYKNKR